MKKAINNKLKTSFLKDVDSDYRNTSMKSSKADSKNVGSKTITQKPDNLLAINKIGSDKTYEFVFDAKYKIETSKEYQRSYGGIGPKEEDIHL